MIIKALGLKATAGTLKEGGIYLYKGLYKLKRIVSIDGNDVYYKEASGEGFCSKANFARTCPTEATPEEIEHCKRNDIKFYGYLPSYLL